MKGSQYAKEHPPDLRTTPIVSQVKKNAFSGEKSVDSISPLW
jgi:hypothetical protein